MRTAYDDTDAEVPRTVLHLVRDLDGKHVEGHNRLRKDVDDRETRLGRLEGQVAEFEDRFKHIAKRTTDITAIRMSPQVVAAIVLFAVTIVTANYAANTGLRDQQSVNTLKLTTIESAIAAQAELKKVETKLEEERAQRMSDAIKRVEARSELTDLKVNSLNEKVSTLTQRK